MTLEKQSEGPKDINDKLSNLKDNLDSNCIPQIEFLFLDNDNNQWTENQCNIMDNICIAHWIDIKKLKNTV